nr:zinc knuckle CX2CX4HX4C [Tanacetum cinerariifolium]
MLLDRERNVIQDNMDICDRQHFDQLLKQEPKREWGGRGVRDKSGVEPYANKDGVAPSITVASGDNSITQEENSVKAGHDNLHDVNAGETPRSFEFSHFIYSGGNGVDVVVPVESIRAISARFANTTYGFFLGKRVAYPIVTNYARNTYG